MARGKAKKQLVVTPAVVLISNVIARKPRRVKAKDDISHQEAKVAKQRQRWW